MLTLFIVSLQSETPSHSISCRRPLVLLSAARMMSFLQHCVLCATVVVMTCRNLKQR